MTEWGGQRAGAGRKPRVPGQLRVTLSTRISETSMARLKDWSQRENKPLGVLLDELLSAHAGSSPPRDPAGLGDDSPPS